MSVTLHERGDAVSHSFAHPLFEREEGLPFLDKIPAIFHHYLHTQCFLKYVPIFPEQKPAAARCDGASLDGSSKLLKDVIITHRKEGEEFRDFYGYLSPKELDGLLKCALTTTTCEGHLNCIRRL